MYHHTCRAVTAEGACIAGETTDDAAFLAAFPAAKNVSPPAAGVAALPLWERQPLARRALRFALITNPRTDSMIRCPGTQSLDCQLRGPICPADALIYLPLLSA